MAVSVTNEQVTLYASNTDVSRDSGVLDRLRTSTASLLAGLGNVANIAAAPRKPMHSNMQKRLKNYRLLATAQHLQIANDVRARKGGKHRTRVCHRNRQYGADSVILRLSPSPADSSAALGNLQTCGSVWACPVCAPRIAAERGKEIQKALDWGKQNGLIPVMLTLTARHTGEMSLDHIKTRFRAAWRFFTKARSWRRFRAAYQVEHTITAREVLYAWQSGNGWHYHMHSLLFIRRDVVRDAIETDMQADLRPDWLAALQKHELDAIDEYGLNVTAHGDVPGKYLAKLGINPGAAVTDARYEISGAGNKQGRSGVNIWTLLERSARRDSAGNPTKGAKLAEKCYLEYITTMQGDNWITWSQGFKALVGVDEQPDEQLAETDDEPAAQDWLRLEPEQWYPVAKTREYAGLLSVAAQTRSKSAVLAFIDELTDAAGMCDTTQPDTHRQPLRDEKPRSFSQIPGPPINSGQNSQISSAGNSQVDQDRRDEIQALRDRLSRWRANREFVRYHIRAPEVRMRELAAFNRMIADGEARLEALRHV